MEDKNLLLALALAKQNGGGGGGSDLPDVTAEDVNRLLGVNYQGQWAKTSKVDTSRTSSYNDNTLYLVTNDENGLHLADTDGRVFRYRDIPSAIETAASNQVSSQLESLIQSKKWTTITTSVTDEESYQFATDVSDTYNRPTFVAGSTSIHVTFQNSNYFVFENYTFVPVMGGVVHTLTSYRASSAPGAVDITIFARYEE